MKRARLLRICLAVLAPLIATIAVNVAIAPPAHADACYTWSRTLRQGMNGTDVTQLQIRVAGWVTSGEVLSYDGDYGARTAAAVQRFQSAYGLGADGVAGPQTFNKIYELQDDDCTPIHFTYAEVSNNCGKGANGYQNGAVSPATVKLNLLKGMWKAEAIRHKLGDNPISISSGFRDYSCNASVGGSSSSRHLYGDALDFPGGGNQSVMCQIARTARTSGFREILGPGFSGHGDHAHLAHKSTQTWSASVCGI
jgi:zinc D-Ala-D-Ala carboxypeptidase